MREKKACSFVTSDKMVLNYDFCINSGATASGDFRVKKMSCDSVTIPITALSEFRDRSPLLFSVQEVNLQRDAVLK